MAAMQATTTWNRKALLAAFEESSLLLPGLILAFDLALFAAGSALTLLAGVPGPQAGRHARRHRRHRAPVPGRP